MEIIEEGNGLMLLFDERDDPYRDELTIGRLCRVRFNHGKERI